MRKLGSATLAVALAATTFTGGALAQDPSSDALSGKLVVWDWHYQLPTTGAALKEIDRQFMELHPGVEIEHVGQPFEQWDQLVRAANAARSGPDVVEALNGLQGAIGYGDQGAMVPLDELVTPEVLAQFSEGNLDSLSEGYDSSNSIYALPWAVQGIVWYYNKALFEKAGLDPERPPATQAEFQAACEALKAAGITPVAAGNKDGTLGHFLWSNHWSQVATPQDSLDLASGAMRFTDPKVKAAVESTAALVTNACVPADYAAIPYFLDGVNLFGAGEAAMVFGLIADAANWKVYNEALGAENVGYFPTPDAQFLQTAPATGWGITSYAKNQPAAVEYVKFVTGPIGQRINFELGGNVPTNKAVDLGDGIPANLRAILSDLATKPTQQFTTAFWKPGTVEDFNAQFQTVLSGGQTIDQMLEAVDVAYQDR